MGAERGASERSCERWIRTVPALLPHELRVSFARAELHVERPERVAVELNNLCLRAEAAEPVATETLGAFVPVVVEPAELERLGALREQALTAALPALGRLLRCASAEHHRSPLEVEEGPRRAGGVPTRNGRELSLGERRALARQPSRATVNKLLRDPHPMVARILLGNPRVTEQDVVFMAARRPAVAEVQVEIARSWSMRARVRMAIVLNPGSPAAVAVPLLGLLGRMELAMVSRALDLPPVVRAVALEHHELRPPPADVPASELRH
ncbi:MAG: hypothetical protein IT373_32350 [Polyangiaceae bacterium]|nr:hypothetical protein [Polyangiaceae bacterium]